MYKRSVFAMSTPFIYKITTISSAVRVLNDFSVMKRQNYYQLTVLLSFVTMATMSFIVLIEIQLMYKYEYIGFEEFFSDIYFLFLSVLDWQVLFLWIIVAIYSDVVSPELSSISVVHTHTLFLFCGLRLLEGGGGGHPPSIHPPSIHPNWPPSVSWRKTDIKDLHVWSASPVNVLR